MKKNQPLYMVMTVMTRVECNNGWREVKEWQWSWRYMEWQLVGPISNTVYDYTRNPLKLWGKR